METEEEALVAVAVSLKLKKSCQLTGGTIPISTFIDGFPHSNMEHQGTDRNIYAQLVGHQQAYLISSFVIVKRLRLVFYCT